MLWVTPMRTIPGSVKILPVVTVSLDTCAAGSRSPSSVIWAFVGPWNSPLNGFLAPVHDRCSLRSLPLPLSNHPLLICLINHLVMTHVATIWYFVDRELLYPPQSALCEAVTSISHIRFLFSHFPKLHRRPTHTLIAKRLVRPASAQKLLWNAVLAM